MLMERLVKFFTGIFIITLLFSPAVFAQEEGQIHVVQPGEGLYGISTLYGVTIEDLESWNDISNGVIHPGDELIVSPPSGESSVDDDGDDSEGETTEEDGEETDDESTEDGAESDDESSEEDSDVGEETVDSYVPTIVRHDYPPEVHVHFQNILNQFADFPTLIQVDMLDEETQYARINKDLNFNNTPLGRVAVLAYTLNKIERGGVSWDQEFAYTDEIETVRSNYAINMNGSSESDFTEGSFTLRELVAGTFENDMNAFYLLLHHVGFENTEDLNLFISNTTGGQFTLDIPTDDVHEFMRYIHDHSDQTMAEIWAEVEDVNSLLGSSDEIFLQLSGENDEVQYLTGIITGDKSYVITIITEHLDTHESEGIAMRINENQSVEVDPHTYAFNELKDYSLARTKTVRYVASVN